MAVHSPTAEDFRESEKTCGHAHTGENPPYLQTGVRSQGRARPHPPGAAPRPPASREEARAPEVPGARGRGGRRGISALCGRGRREAGRTALAAEGGPRRYRCGASSPGTAGSQRAAAASLPLGCHCTAAPMLRFPTCFPSFRVVGEKQLPQEIIFLVWSPKRDLIALANTAGEVSEPDRQRARHRLPQPQFPLR